MIGLYRIMELIEKYYKCYCTYSVPNKTLYIHLKEGIPVKDYQVIRRAAMLYVDNIVVESDRN
ncbi:MAG: hypothetical protein IJV31_08150 [Clostridia bacterium]|nr:hypothetical protein [Clostridia bacterium]